MNRAYIDARSDSGGEPDGTPFGGWRFNVNRGPDRARSLGSGAWRRKGTVLACMVGWLVCAGWSMAQVTVSVTLDQNQVLVGESIRAVVRITNFSGQTLQLGEDNHWLRFSIETPQGLMVPSLGSVPVEGAFLLESSKRAIKRVNLTPYFDLGRPGRYRITAGVWIQEWGQEISSQPVSVDLIRGTTLWEQPFGVPQPAGASGPPEVRRYALQQAMHMKRMTLYARVTDNSGERVHALLPLGLLLTFSEPEKQIDRESHLHVLWQTGARQFNYSVLNPDGELVVRQIHEYSHTRPVLRRDQEGRIVVWGGVRRPTFDDIPPWRPYTEPVESQPPDTGWPAAD